MRYILFIALLTAVPGMLAAEDPKADPALPGLIAKLGDDDFEAREAAEKAIMRLGLDREEEFAPVLKAAQTKEPDAEVRSRLEKLIRRMTVLGAIDWSVEAGEIFQLPAIYNKRVYIGNKDGHLLCYDAITGQLHWKYANGGFIFKSVAVAGGRVVLIRTRKDGLPDGCVLALDAQDGHELWTWQDEKRSQIWTAPIVSDGAIYVGRENKLLCIDALQGELRWSVQVVNSIQAPPSISAGKVVFGQYGGKLMCVNAKDGKPVWELDLEGPAYADASIDGDKVYAAGGSTVYRLDLNTGAKIWESAGSDAIGQSLAIKGGKVLAAHSQNLRCLNAENGKELWTKETGGHIYAAPAFVGDRCYVGSSNNKLTMYCLDAATGKEHWIHTTIEGGYAEPIVVGRRLYMGYHSKFYCLKTGVPGPEAWPMSGGNPGRTGCND